jgi:hypothetical protein
MDLNVLVIVLAIIKSSESHTFSEFLALLEVALSVVSEQPRLAHCALPCLVTPQFPALQDIACHDGTAQDPMKGRHLVQHDFGHAPQHLVHLTKIQFVQPKSNLYVPPSETSLQPFRVAQQHTGST